MSYIDAILDREKDRIHVVERNEHGEREYKDYAADYIFFYEDPKGKHQTIYRTPVTKFVTHSGNEFRKELKVHSSQKLWESDCNAIFRCLETNYINVNSPKLHTCFFDIETDFAHGPAPEDLVVLVRNHTKSSMSVKELRTIQNKEAFEVFDPRIGAWLYPSASTLLEKTGPIGYAPTSDPFNKITAITVYLDWIDKLITLALPPRTMSWEAASEIAAKFDNTYLFEKESEMLDTFLNLIDDADILSGWNSEGYDIPYTVGRIQKVLSKTDLRRLCLWDQMPKKREFERFGAFSITYDLIGRIHLDYMQLYRKYTYEERHSYSLDAIGEYELNERKLAYEGSLDQLYNQDFYKFLDYNRQDTKLLANLDKKLQFMDLANELAHENTVLLQTTMGAVAVTDQAIINEAHRLGFVVPSRKPSEKKPEPVKKSKRKKDDDEDDDHSGSAAGAYVAYPKIGMHKDIGAIDINSLYPSAIRALNMGPETIVGQLRPVMTEQHINERMADKIVGKKVMKGTSFAGAWEGLFGSLEYTAVIEMNPDIEITIDWEGAESTVHTADEVWRIIFEGGQKWMLSANGTIFKYDFEGIIPGLLKRWYAERKVLQKKKNTVGELQSGIKLSDEMSVELAAAMTTAVASASTGGAIDVPKMKELIEASNMQELASYIKLHQLEFAENKITANLDQIKYATSFWDKKQQVKKINLNSLYGALLNPGCRFNDHRIGQSTTLTGRTIAKHMDSFVNECITGEYKYDGDAVIYGDSVTGDSLIKTDSGEITIAEMFAQCGGHDTKGEKEYGFDTSAKVVGFNIHDDKPIMSEVSYVIRHKTKKKLYKITTESGESSTVTEDHSIMVDRDGFTIEVKPTQLLPSDLAIRFVKNMAVSRTHFKLVECLGEVDDYVYDISVTGQDPVFFANDLLHKNTDSVYFSAWPMVKAEVEAGRMEWNKDICVQLYDNIAEQVNQSFPKMMAEACNCPLERGELIKGGRELIASSGLFVKKKRYAVLIFDMEGTRLDLMDEKTATKKGVKPGVGKVKAMGLDLKRSDTPRIVQDFLSDILMSTLTGATKEKVIEDIIKFKTMFAALPAWEKGTPKRVNNLTAYGNTEEQEGKSSMPGHVRAAINWNKLRQMNSDNHSMRIVDGQKVIVCKLKNNPMGYNSVAYPIDVAHIPEWFKELPFDNESMESAIVDQKVENLLGVLKWDLTNNISISSTFNSLFEF